MISCSPFEHESLLVDNESKLSVAEKREAREGYQREKQKDQLRPPLTLANFSEANNFTNNPMGSFNHYKLSSPSQYHVPGHSGGSSFNASLLGLLTGTSNKSQQQQQKPVANIRPFSVRSSSSGPYNVQRNDMANQQQNIAPWSVLLHFSKVVNCFQTKFVAIILVLLVFFNAIFRSTDFSSDPFDCLISVVCTSDILHRLNRKILFYFIV